MDYSTFNIKNFYIKKDSTLPELKFPLTQQLMEQYDITKNMLENVAITASMVDAETGIYRIANSAGNLVINNNRPEYPDEEQYTLVYRFKLRDTRKTGKYCFEFVIDFISSNTEDGCGKIKLPVIGYINVIIFDSITKTSII